MLETGPDRLEIALGAVVRRWRKSLRLSLTEPRETIGFTVLQIHKDEQETNRVNVSTLTRIAKALGRRPSTPIAEREPPGAPEAASDAARLLAQPETADLVEAFQTIRSQGLRQGVLDLARALPAAE